MKNPFRKKKNSAPYPLNTCRNFYGFVKRRLEMTDVRIVCEVVRKVDGRTECRVSDLLKIVKATRVAEGKHL